MSDVTAVSTQAAPAPRGAYSQGLRIGDVIYSCGVGPRDPATGTIVGATVGEQARQCFRNLGAILDAGSASLSDLISLRVYLADIERDFEAFDRVCVESLTQPYPVRTTVGATLLGILIEVEAVAMVRR